MKFYCGTKGLVQSLTALFVSAGIIVSLWIPARASRSRFQVAPETTVQPQGNKISAATAATATSGVVIQWRSALDPDNLGFNIYRLQAGVRLRANREIVPGAIFVANQRTLPSDVHSYSWFDRAGTPDSIYYIESVSARGITQLDNRAITVTTKSNVAFASGQATNQLEAADDADNSSPQKSFPAAAATTAPVPNGALEDQWSVAAKPGLKISIKSDGWYRVTQQDMAAAGFNPAVDIRNLRLFGDGQELAINTSQALGPFSSGDYIEFYGRGIDVPTSDTRTYYLIADSVPGKRVRGELHLDSAPSSAPALPPVASLPVVERPSWFGFVWTFLSLPETPISGAGEVRTVSQPQSAREPERASETAPLSAAPAAPEPIAVRPVTSSPAQVVNQPQEQWPEAPVPSPPTKKATVRKKAKQNRKTTRRHYNHAETTNTIAPANFAYTVEQKDRFNYFLNVLNGDAENFFGRVLSSVAVNQTLTAPNPDSTSAGPVRLEIALQGVSILSHQVNIQLNNVALGSLNYFGVDHAVQSFDVPLSLLQNGANTLTFTPVAGGGVSLVDYARLTYPHAYRADSDKLKFNVRGTQSVTVDGFSTPNVRLIDYTDPLAVTIAQPATQATASGYAITVPINSARGKAQRLFYAIPDGQFLQPASLVLNQPSTLNLASNAADFLIIAHKDIIPALGPLVAARQNQFTVSVVDVDDIYDEFGYGLHGPQAIKDFLSFAVTHWSVTPRYVLLAGDASYDPRNYMFAGNFDLVPTKLVDATYNETASDDWLADFDNDGTADIAVGRLPVRTASDASLLISKIVNFAPANVPQDALLVADDPGTPAQWDFETANDDVQALLPASMTVQRVNVRTEPSIAQATADIVSGLNQGRAIVNYSGHGSINVWSGSSIFDNAHATALTNGDKLSFVIVMDCLNGFFHDPNLQSLSEAFLLAPNGGAVAAFASSGLTSTPGQRQMELQLYSSLYGGQSIRVGDAIRTAKAATSDFDVRRTWIYFGDPSLKIR
jgi:peptidase C25-like protein